MDDSFLCECVYDCGCTVMTGKGMSEGFSFEWKAYLGSMVFRALDTDSPHTLTSHSFPDERGSEKRRRKGKERVPLVKDNNKAIEATTKM